MRKVGTHNGATNFRASPATVKKLFNRLDAFPNAKIPAGELSIAFLDDPEICRLHTQFLNDPTPTDVITFPADNADDANANNTAANAFAGEICVCVPQARREAPKHGNTLAAELLLYLAHGWLHLAGYDDHSDADRAAMRQAEQSVLRWLTADGFAPEALLFAKPPCAKTRRRL